MPSTESASFSAAMIARNSMLVALRSACRAFSIAFTSDIKNLPVVLKVQRFAKRRQTLSRSLGFHFNPIFLGLSADITEHSAARQILLSPIDWPLGIRAYFWCRAVLTNKFFNERCGVEGHVSAADSRLIEQVESRPSGYANRATSLYAPASQSQAGINLGHRSPFTDTGAAS